MEGKAVVVPFAFRPVEFATVQFWFSCQRFFAAAVSRKTHHCRRGRLRAHAVGHEHQKGNHAEWLRIGLPTLQLISLALLDPNPLWVWLGSDLGKRHQLQDLLPQLFAPPRKLTWIHVGIKGQFRLVLLDIGMDESGRIDETPVLATADKGLGGRCLSTLNLSAGRWPVGKRCRAEGSGTCAEKLASFNGTHFGCLLIDLFAHPFTSADGSGKRG